MTNKRICIECKVPMKNVSIDYKGVKLEARQCPKCKEKIFTEDLAMKAISKLEAKRMEERYVKHPIKIGNSWGMTFPKEVTRVFGLENPKTTFTLTPMPEKGKIEISLS